MAVDVGISHMTLLIVTLAFSLVNICLIIATGGIIYNWQDRFVGPIMKCEQPKWTSDGRNGDNARVGYIYDDWNNNNNNVNWNVNTNTNVNNNNNNANWNTNTNVNTNTNWGNTWGYTLKAASGVLGSSSWTWNRDGSWTTCPTIEFPRWQAPQPQVQTTWTAWVAQPTWVAAPVVNVQPAVAWVTVPQPPLLVAQPISGSVSVQGK